MSEIWSPRQNLGTLRTLTVFSLYISMLIDWARSFNFFDKILTNARALEPHGSVVSIPKGVIK